MGLFSRGKKKEKEKEFKEAVALTQTQAEGQERTPGEYIDSVGRTYYMIRDDREDQLLNSEQQLSFLGPAFSPLNQLTNINEKEALIRRLKYKILLLKLKGYMNTREYAKGGSILISSLELRSRSIVSDAERGWKGKILTEQTKTTRIELEKRKKGRI